jgi:hypothetical protein
MHNKCVNFQDPKLYGFDFVVFQVDVFKVDVHFVVLVRNIANLLEC